MSYTQYLPILNHFGTDLAAVAERVVVVDDGVDDLTGWAAQESSEVE